MILDTKPLIRRGTEDTPSLLVVQFLIKTWVPCASPLLPFYSLDYLVWQTETTLSCLTCFLFPPKSPRFPHVCVRVCIFVSVLHQAIGPQPFPVIP